MEGGVTGKGWKPGQSGNPKGRTKLERDIKEVLKEQRSEIVAILVGLLNEPITELKRIGEDSSERGIVGACARIIYQGWNKSDPSRIGWVFGQCAALLPQKLELTGEDGDEISKKITVEVVDYRANAHKDLPNPKAK